MNDTTIVKDLGVHLIGPKAEHITTGVIEILLLFLGLTENFWIIMLFVKYDQLRSPSNTLLMHLSIANLGLCFMVMPFSTLPHFYGYWIYGSTGCVYYGFAGMFCGLAIIGIITLFGIDRYLVICKPQIAIRMKYLHYSLLSLAVWCYSFFWSILPASTGYSLEPHSTGCGINWRKNDGLFVTYMLCLTIGCFMLPILIMLFCYWQAKVVLYKPSSFNSASTNEANPVALNADWVDQKEITTLGISLGIVFLISWTPYTIVNMWAACGNPEDVPDILTSLAPLAGKSAVVINPLLTVAISRKFRTYSKMMLFCQTDMDSEIPENELQDATIW